MPTLESELIILLFIDLSLFFSQTKFSFFINNSIFTTNFLKYDNSIKKLKDAGAKILTLEELIESNPQGKNIKLVV